MKHCTLKSRNSHLMSMFRTLHNMISCCCCHCCCCCCCYCSYYCLCDWVCLNRSEATLQSGPLFSNALVVTIAGKSWDFARIETRGKESGVEYIEKKTRVVKLTLRLRIQFGQELNSKSRTGTEGQFFHIPFPTKYCDALHAVLSFESIKHLLRTST